MLYRPIDERIKILIGDDAGPSAGSKSAELLEREPNEDLYNDFDIDSLIIVIAGFSARFLS